MAEDVARLFDDYAVRFRRGERPDLRDYLRRAGGGADELAALVDRFLQAAPPPEPGEEAVAVSRAWVAGDSPLLELRARRGLRRAEVVDALIERLGLDPEKRAKVRFRYHELESGLLDVRRVDRRLWEALAATLRAAVSDVRALRPPDLDADLALRAAPAYYRADPDAEALPPPTFHPERIEERDEIDRLFGIGD